MNEFWYIFSEPCNIFELLSNIIKEFLKQNIVWLINVLIELVHLCKFDSLVNTVKYLSQL